MNWHLYYGNQQFGPMDTTAARTQAAAHPEALAWREGLADWVPVRHIAELAADPSMPAPPSAIPLPSNAIADDVDYSIVGSEMQFVEIELDPGESVLAEAGAMMYKDAYVEMDTIFGDGSRSGGGFFDKLLGAGKRILTGESLFMTVFTHRGQGKAKAAFAAPYPGNIIPVNLRQAGGSLICQKDSFLCAAKGVSIGVYFQRKILTGLFGGEGFIMQKLDGDGMAFLHAGGTVVERHLNPGEILHLDTGCLVAMEPSVQFEIRQAGNVKTALLGGEGLFFAELQGPGKIWLQSLPFSRLAGRMLAAAPQRGGGRDEGSIVGRTVLGGTMLGGLGGLFGGEDDE